MKKNYGYIYTLPLTIWLTFFFTIPTLIIFFYSFMKKAPYGGIVLEFSLDAYKSLLNPYLLKVIWNTIHLSVLSTFITLILSIPTAYYIARSKYKNLLLLLIIIPFWTNFLIRIFAWISILGNNGFINNILLSLGLIKEHIQLLYNKTAVIIVLIYTSLPYAILPLYSSIEKFDFSLLEAARDLGATKSYAMMKVFLPGIKAGIITAIIFTFIPNIGAYAVPQLVGGNDSLMLGNIIAKELTVNRNWPLASAMSAILTIITTIGILIFVNSKQKEEYINIK